MQYVKTFYEERKGSMDVIINEYLSKNPDQKIEMLTSGSIVNEYKTVVFTVVVFNDGSNCLSNQK